MTLDPLPDASWTRASADHLLNRAGFGGSPSRRDAFYRLGRDGGVLAAVDSLLEEGIPLEEFAFPEWTNYDTRGRPLNEADRPGEGPFANLVPGTFLVLSSRLAFFDEWYIRHMLEGVPVAAKMFKFLVDHFPIDFRRMYGDRVYTLSFRYFDLLRRHSLGNFQDLVLGVSRSSAMMFMLDLQVNTKQNINENFGRELLELFTMGVGGGYTEEDVLAAAKAFTGQRFLPLHPFNAVPEGRYIDGSEKVILGRTLEAFDPTAVAPAENHGPAVVELVMDHPSTARYLSWKLWRYFASENPPEGLVDALATRFREDYTYEFKPLLRDMLASEAFFAADNVGRQIKDPVDFIVTATRQLEAPLLPPHTLHFALEEMGMGVLTPPSIAGWPDPIGSGNQWLGAGAVISRLNLPSLWLSGNETVLKNSRDIPRGDHVYAELPLPALDLEQVAPKPLRGRSNLNRLLDSLTDRFLPGVRLTSRQRRALFNFADRPGQFSESAEEDSIREIIRHLMAMPEYQLQ